MKKIKLFVDAHVFDDYFQGSRTYIKGLYQALAKLNSFDISLAANNVETLENEFAGSKISFVKLESKNKFKRLAQDIPGLINKHKYDVAHFQYIGPLFKNCLWVTTIHDLLFNDFPDQFSYTYRLKNNFLFKRTVNKTDLLLSVSNYSAKSIEKHFNWPQKDILITPNCIDSTYFEEFDKKLVKNNVFRKWGLGNYILYVSRIEPRKNHASLVNAFTELGLDKKGYKLVFVGKLALNSPELDSALNRLDKEVRSKVLHLEGVNNKDLLELYRGADLFVYPSIAEGFGIPPLEAWATGTPTICSNATAMSDFDFLGEYLYDPLNINELKQKISSVLLGYEGTAVISNNLRHLIQETYSWDHVAKLYADKLITLREFL